MVLSDVFTRELRAVPVASKDPATVAGVLKPMIANITEGDENYTLSTDKGAEVTRLDLPAEAVHRLKAGKQDLAVIDRGIQTLKKGLACKTAKNNKEWDENLPGVQRAYNATPHSTTIVAPEVELEPAALFRSFQRNADNFIVNRAQSERRMGEIKETKTIRAPLRQELQASVWGRAQGEECGLVVQRDDQREACAHQRGAGYPGRQRAAAGRTTHGPRLCEAPTPPTRSQQEIGRAHV